MGVGHVNIIAFSSLSHPPASTLLCSVSQFQILDLQHILVVPKIKILGMIFEELTPFKIRLTILLKN